MQAVWEAFRASPWGHDDRWLALAVFTLSHHLAFYGYEAFMVVVRRFQLFEQYKIDANSRGGKEPPAELVARAWRDVLIGHFLLFPVLLYFGVQTFQHWGMFYIDGPLPSLGTVVLQLLLFLLVEDTFFYWAHRLLHNKLIYKYVHKQHHEFKYNIGISSEYDNPVETIAIQFGTMLGPLFVKPHLLVLGFWIAYRTAEGFNAHTGYSFPFMPFQLIEAIQGGSERHEFHHSHNVGSFGSQFTFWDWFMGTDIPFRVYRITSLNATKRDQFSQRSSTFSINLSDKSERSHVLSLFEALKVGSKAYGDSWTNITLDGMAVKSLEEIPSKGQLRLTHTVYGASAKKVN